MSTRWDFTGYDKQNNLVLVVEAKTKLGASAEWAAQLRRNTFAHGVYPNAPYFLMAFPDKFFLWVTAYPLKKQQPCLMTPLPLFLMTKHTQRTSLGRLLLGIPYKIA